MEMVEFLGTLGVTAMLIIGGKTFLPTHFRLLGVILTGHAQPDPNQFFSLLLVDMTLPD